MGNRYKHDYGTISSKIFRKIHIVFFGLIGKRERSYPLYASYRHRNKKPRKNKNVQQYMTQQPNYGAGFGHGIDIWRNGIVNAELFGVHYAYTPMVSEAWEEALGLGEGEARLEELKRQGYRIVQLPYYDPSEEESVRLIQQIIESYYGESVIFCNEFEQGSRREDYMLGVHYMREHFWKASQREKDRLVYRAGEFSVAVHIRRGDVKEGLQAGDANMQKRWLEESYYIRIMRQLLSCAGDSMPLRFYIFSEGDREDFPLLNGMVADGDTKLEFCLDMSAVESFLHMCRADLLVTGLSSFSYDPGLINPALKIAPASFWNPYPEDGEWLIADENGKLAAEDILCLKTYIHFNARGDRCV